MAEQHTEYLRRNLQGAKAYGAHAASVKAIERLLQMKRPPVWIIAAFEGIRDRTAGLGAELAAWRDQADDAPDYVRPHGVEGRKP